MICRFKGDQFQLVFDLLSIKFKLLEISVTDAPGTWIATGELKKPE